MSSAAGSSSPPISPKALKGAEAVFIAVGTPSRRGDGHADLSYVFAAVEELAGLLEGPMVVVTKSTVPVGTGDKIAALLKEKGAPDGVSVASNPEFLREGAAIADFKHPDRILVGAEDDQARARAGAKSIGRCSSTGRRCCSPAGARPS